MTGRGLVLDFKQNKPAFIQHIENENTGSSVLLSILSVNSITTKLKMIELRRIDLLVVRDYAVLLCLSNHVNVINISTVMCYLI